MTGTALEDRLAQLREAGPASQGRLAPPSPDGLWDRGRSWARRRRVVTATACAAVVAVVGATVAGLAPTLDSSTEVVPAVSDGVVALPREVHNELSPFLPDAAPERALAVAGFERTNLSGTRTGIAMIGAHSGGYGFVETPGRLGSVFLAPEGRYVAWWTEGKTTSTPALDLTVGGVVTALTVLDLTSGRAEKYLMDDEHGVNAAPLVWVDGSHLVVETWVKDEPETRSQLSSRTAVDLIDVESGTRKPVPWGEAWEPVDLASTDGSHVLLRSEKGYGIGAVDSPDVERLQGDVPEIGTSGVPVMGLSDDGRLAALSNDDPPGESSNLIARVQTTRQPVQEPGALQWTEFEAELFDGIAGVTGWRDDRVVLQSWSRGGSLELVDLERGATTTLTKFVKKSTSDENTVWWTWAGDLLEDATLVDGHEPARPADPRLVLGGGVGAVVLLVGGLVVWRRRGHV